MLTAGIFAELYRKWWETYLPLLRRGKLSYMQKDRFLPAEMQCWIWMCRFTRELVIEIDMELLTGMSWRTFKEGYKENECVSLLSSPSMFTVLMAESVSYRLHEEGWQSCIRIWIFMTSLNFLWFLFYFFLNFIVSRTSYITFHVVILCPFS